jgi:hypothetical protein
MKAARLLTHQRKIDRYQKLLNELRFIEQQVSEDNKCLRSGVSWRCYSS